MKSWCVTFADGQLIASGGADRQVRIWDAKSGQERLKFHAAASRMNAIAYSPDGKRLATGSLDGPIGLWDAATGSPSASCGATQSPFSSWPSAGRTKLISAGQHATIKLWDLTQEAGLRLFRGGESAAAICA